MGKIVLLIFLCFSLKADVYENNCVSCHKKLPVSIDKYFYRYLLKYSSQEEVSKALVDYLKNPKEQNTVMPEAFIKRFGIKKKSTLSNKDLQKAIDIYWEKYKIFGRLK